MLTPEDWNAIKYQFDQLNEGTKDTRAIGCMSVVIIILLCVILWRVW